MSQPRPPLPPQCLRILLVIEEQKQAEAQVQGSSSVAAIAVNDLVSVLQGCGHRVEQAHSRPEALRRVSSCGREGVDAPELLIQLASANISEKSASPPPPRPSSTSAAQLFPQQQPDFGLLRDLAFIGHSPVLLALPTSTTNDIVQQALDCGAEDVVTLPLRRQEACMLWQHIYKSTRCVPENVK